ncbi:MAG TPA: response regulator, partial [Anaerolineae bacterium]|nr:response regulator [Anaerolineae bacterium]
MGTPTRVLYIEDDQACGRLVQRVLQRSGYEVLLAFDGAEGMTLAQKMQPNLILMDINLPEVDGRVLTTRLRSTPQCQETPIVALTAMTGSEERKLALAAGCTGFLTKPINIDRFPQQIDAFLRGEKQKLPPAEQQHHLE